MNIKNFISKVKFCILSCLLFEWKVDFKRIITFFIWWCWNIYVVNLNLLLLIVFGAFECMFWFWTATWYIQNFRIFLIRIKLLEDPWVIFIFLVFLFLMFLFLFNCFIYWFFIVNFRFIDRGISDSWLHTLIFD